MTKTIWAVPNDADILTILAERIDAQHRGVGIVVGVISENGRRVIAHGEMCKGDGRLPDGDTLFEIASITKVFTGLLLAEMVERGEIALDDPVAKYLPARVTMPERDGRPITLADLATHTSGLPMMPNNLAPRDHANPLADYTVDQLYEFLSGHALARGPGEHFQYSNLGFGVLGHVLALRADVDFETLLRQRITGLLEMTSTGLPAPDLAGRLAKGHDYAGQPAPNWDMPTLAGNGALWSTANDLLNFSAAELGYVETPLKGAMTAQLLPRRPRDADSEIALGWSISMKEGREVVWKNGRTAGYCGFLGFDMQSGIGVAVLANSSSPPSFDDMWFHLLTGAPLTPAVA
jgi:D-alanyl-D-alanine-carboxypeptidase/D-alanyl-D-alanine-endopeptidase